MVFADAEFAFGTYYQRCLNTLGVRLHYGHPDFFDAKWALVNAGLSKCSQVGRGAGAVPGLRV